MSKHALRSLQFVLTVIALSAVLSGCNTMEGVGKDIQGAGQSLQKSAEKNK